MNEIVSFEIAKLLKEVGFDSEYYKYYYEGFYFNKMVGQGCCILVTPES